MWRNEIKHRQEIDVMYVHTLDDITRNDGAVMSLCWHELFIRGLLDCSTLQWTLMVFDCTNLNFQMFDQQQSQWSQTWHTFTWPADESTLVTHCSQTGSLVHRRYSKEDTSNAFHIISSSKGFPVEWRSAERMKPHDAGHFVSPAVLLHPRDNW